MMEVLKHLVEAEWPNTLLYRASDELYTFTFSEQSEV